MPGQFEKVLLVCPSLPSDYKIDKHLPPLNLLSLATYLRANGVDARILDLKSKRGPGVSETISEFKPDLLGATCYSIFPEKVREICDEARRAGIPSIVGGRHPSKDPKTTALATGADAIAVGEGEDTLLEICKRGGFSGKTRGLFLKAGRKKGGFFFTGARGYAPNLDSLPFPDRTLLEKYPPVEGMPYPFSRKETFAMESRGCPYSCTFCSMASRGGPLRFRSVESAVREVSEISDLGYSQIYFCDEIFGKNRTWISEFADGLARGGISGKISWRCQRRVDNTDERMLSDMLRAGCDGIYFGVESGSQRVLDSMRKGIKIAQVKRAFSLAKKAGLRTYAYFMLGYLGETWEDIEKTRELIREIDPDALILEPFCPLAGTPAYDEAVEKGLIEKGADWDCLDETLISPRGNGVLSKAELLEARKDIYREFYLSPKAILKRLPRVLSGNFARNASMVMHNLV